MRIELLLILPLVYGSERCKSKDKGAAPSLINDIVSTNELTSTVLDIPPTTSTTLKPTPVTSIGSADSSIPPATSSVPGSPTSSILPSGYKSIQFGQSRAQIEGYTQETIQDLLRGVKKANGQFAWPSDNLFWPSANGWQTIARYDLTRKTTRYHDQFSSAQDAMMTTPGGCYKPGWGVGMVNCFNDDAGWAALASLAAYEAYGDQKFLDRGISIWDFLNAHGYISDQVISDGYLKGTKSPKNTIKAKCDGKSMIGGVYWKNGYPDDPAQQESTDNAGVNAVSTGLFALMGADLCRITGDMEYCDKAYSSMQWLDRFMVSPQGLVWDNIGGSSCTITDWTFTYNAGLYIAAYAQLGYVTKNQTAIALAERTAKAAMSTELWNNADGVINDGQGPPAEDNDGVGFKAVLVRALHKAHPWVSLEIQKAIVGYLNMQYYAVTQLASNSRTHPVEYGRNWTGPGFEVSNSKTNMVGLDVLNTVNLNADEAFPKESDSPVADIT